MLKNAGIDWQVAVSKNQNCNAINEYYKLKDKLNLTEKERIIIKGAIKELQYE